MALRYALVKSNGLKPVVTKLFGPMALKNVNRSNELKMNNDKEKIMQPFFTTKPTGEGTGLGLSLAYDMVVKGHGGSITLDSKDGGGAEFTVFTITLPI